MKARQEERRQVSELALLGTAFVLAALMAARLAFCLQGAPGFWYYWCLLLPVPA